MMGHVCHGRRGQVKLNGLREKLPVRYKELLANIQSCVDFTFPVVASAADGDGKPLPEDRGPLRLVVLTDKEPSRSIYNLRKLEILDLRGKSYTTFDLAAAS
jgi:hypothetical protein